MEALVGWILTGGLQQWIFVDNVPFGSERILVDGVLVKYQLFGSMQGEVGVGLGRRAHKTLVPGVIEGQSSLLCACLTCMTFCSVVPEGSSLCYAINRIKPV